MTTHDEFIAELKATREDCQIAGCTNNMVTKDQCEDNHKGLKLCMTGLKDTMQTKNSFVWEIIKVIGIPLLTFVFMWWGLFSGIQAKMQAMDEIVKKLDALVIELIMERR